LLKSMILKSAFETRFLLDEKKVGRVFLVSVS
jgi:hypothetical protein